MTDLDDFHYFNLAGFSLSTEESTVLKNSLLIKKDQEKLVNITLWGKITGIQKDYFIAQARQEALFSYKYYYSYTLF